MFRGVDFYNVDELLSDEDRLVRQSIREFLENEVAPLVADAWHEEKPLNFHVLAKVRRARNARNLHSRRIRLPGNELHHLRHSLPGS